MVARRAWLGDDAFITLRVVDNFVRGYGLTWNPGERVQVYTHPLWMFLLSGVYSLTREAFYTPLLTSLAACYLSCALLAFGVASDRRVAALALAWLALSRSFVDFSTSGLENSLSHLILVLFLIQYLFPPALSKRRIFFLSLTASLGMLNRLDLGLLFLPMLAQALFRAPLPRKAAVLPAALGQFPLLAWLAFALFYYGFPLPNTYYAKLTTGIPWFEYLRQGLAYFLDGWVRDPLTMLLIVLGIVAAWVSRRNPRLPWAGAGVLLYLGYILWIGGDFMSGRFFTVPLLACVSLLVLYLQLPSAPRWAPWLGSAVLLLGLLVPGPTFVAIPHAYRLGVFDPDVINTDGIADERGFYFATTGLVVARPGQDMPVADWRAQGEQARKAPGVYVRESIGMFGYYAGPGVTVVDQLALADPLLARLPIDRSQPWRIGHFLRLLPAGYLESLQQGRDLIADPRLADFYRKLALVSRGPLWDPQRLHAILQLNLGGFGP